jgi:hypothetical protein
VGIIDLSRNATNRVPVSVDCNPERSLPIGEEGMTFRVEPLCNFHVQWSDEIWVT